MSRREVLRTHTAQDLTWWQAYEEAYGPLDDSWTNECFAEIHEMLQNVLWQQSQGEGNKPVKKDRPGFMVDVQEAGNDEEIFDGRDEESDEYVEPEMLANLPEAPKEG